MLYLFYRLLSHFGPQHWWPAKTPFEVMVGAILTQNTSWNNVEKAIKRLDEAGALDPQVVSSMDITQLERLIKPSGFFRVKAARLKALVEYIMVEFHGDVEAMGLSPGWELRRDLLSIHGIGEETADSILLYALEKPFFVVDAYTKRILKRCGLIRGSESYGDIQRLFMDALPGDVELFKEYHALLVELGKGYCKSRNPRCEECPLTGEVCQWPR